MKRRAVRLAAGAFAAALLATTAVAAGQSAAYAAPSGVRDFDISTPHTGGRFTGTIDWFDGTSNGSPGGSPIRWARIVNAKIADTAADDYRAVAYVYAEYTTYHPVCAELGCNWEPDPPIAASVYVANATPNGVRNDANWPLQDTPAARPFEGGYVWAPGGVARLLVRVCTEQWRYEPNQVIECSNWR